MKHKLFFCAALFLCLQNLSFGQTELWSTTPNGGGNGTGTIYKLSANGSNYSTVFDFNSTGLNGASPEHSTPCNGGNGKLYGMTRLGGALGMGLIFSFDTTTSELEKIHSFGLGIDGQYPYGSLMLASDGKLYGMTSGGGSLGHGTIFKLDPVTNNYTKLKDLNSTLNSANPHGDLLEASNGLLYGLSASGGSNGNGTLFSFDLSTNTITRLVSFTGSVEGSSPNGTLIQASNGKLYGMTVSGGTTSNGTIFSYDISTSTFSKRYEFNSTTSGRYPRGKLIEHPSGLLYGLTQVGGTAVGGTLFSFDDNLLAFNVIHNFSTSLSTDGKNPYGSLLLASNGLFYGLTQGGTPYGILFSCTTAGTFLKLASFDGSANGTGPQGSLVEMGSGKLYGMATSGGTGNNGTFYRFNITGSVFTKLENFASNPNGFGPQSGLLKAANGKIYSMTSSGGTNNSGVLFKLNSDSGTFLKVHDFANFSAPRGKLMQASNGKLYGTTFGGGSTGAGTIFSLDTSTNVVATVYNFILTSPNSKQSEGGLIQASNGLLYGMTRYGGVNSKGTLFSFNISTSTFTQLFDFGSSGNGDFPFEDLIQTSTGKLYGMTYGGGTNGNGVLFSFDPITNTYSKKIDFSSSTNGRNPNGSLIEASNGKLYGTTSGGGSINDGGTIFSFDTSTNILSKLYVFPGSSNDSTGNYPLSTLFQATNGLMYGTTSNGGINGYGVIYSFDPVSNTYSKIKDLDYSIASDPRKAAFIEVGISIQTGTVLNTICPGGSIGVPFNCSGTLNGANIFTAQLSDNLGSFSSPINIGTLTGTSSGTIQAVIPTNSVSGSAYRIRVVSSDPVISGTSTPNTITISPFQVPLFIETMGSVVSTTSISSHESSNGFDNDGFTMSGTSDVRNTPASSGYVGASGGANIFIASSLGKTFQISGINTIGLSGLALNFGIYKNSTFNSDAITVQYSTDGTTFITLNYPSLPSGAGTNSWFNRTTTTNIPSVSNLRIKFVQNNFLPSIQYSIDDVKLIYNANSMAISPAGPFDLCPANSVTLYAPDASSYLWSNSSTLDSLVVTTPGNYSCILTSESSCTIQSNTVVVNTAVQKYNVTGGGVSCSAPGSSPVNIGLDGSQLNRTYQLLLNNSTPIGSPVPGTGGAIFFGDPGLSGTYRVIGTNASPACTDTMNGSASVTVITATTYYLDSDGDGFGNFALDTMTCAGPPSGYVSNNTDCNDADSLERPNQIWYTDADADGYGTGSSIVSCTRPLNGFIAAELILVSGDCNDAVNAAYPGATEICNGIDDDCDSYIDEGCGAPIHCIGPSASYTAPSGPSYINQYSPFPTLTAAVAALNGFTPDHEVIFEFQGDYTSTSETFPISITYEGNAASTAIFRPRIDQATQLLIQGNAALSNRLIYFNGADYVSFDGSAGGIMSSNSKLIVRNLYTLSTAGSNIEFANDATHNVLNALQLEGGFNASACVTISGTSSANGNDFLSIQNCTIRDRSDISTSPPQKGITSTGTGTGLTANSNNTIHGNYFQNTLGAINVGSTGNNGPWVISDNHIFTSTGLTIPSSFYAIHFYSTDTSSVVISGNSIGGSSAFAAGTAMQFVGGTNFRGIYMDVASSSRTSSISNNTVRNIVIKSASTYTFGGIETVTGPIHVTGNNIGDPLVPNSILFSDSTLASFIGISCNSSQNVHKINIAQNTVSNVSILDTAGTSKYFYGINYFNNSLLIDTTFVSKNVIKHLNYSGKGDFAALKINGGQNGTAFTDIAENIVESINLTLNFNATSYGIYISSAPARVYGNRIGSSLVGNDINIGRKGKHYGFYIYPINSVGTIIIDQDTIQNVNITQTDNSSIYVGMHVESQFNLVHQVTNNCIKNIHSLSTLFGGSSNEDVLSSIIGLFTRSLRSGLPVDIIRSNQISELQTNTTTFSRPLITGMLINNKDANIIGNKLFKFRNSGTGINPYPVIEGILVMNMDGGMLANNMIAIDNDGLSNSIHILGIKQSTAGLTSTNYFYNTIAISGSGSAGFSIDYYRNYSNPSAPGGTMRNNIFYNSRTSSEYNYSIFSNPASANWTSTTSDYNLFYCPDSTYVASWGGLQKSFSTFKSASGGDSHSIFHTVSFVDISQDLHLNTPGNCFMDGAGIPVANILDDIDLQARDAVTPDIGADEFSTTSTLATIGPITGPSTVCQGQTSVNYSVPVLAGATSYLWTLPVGASLVSGTNSTSISVDFTSNASSGNIAVHATDGDCISNIASLAITTNNLPSNSSFQTFTNNAGIAINDNSAASPYPSTISVSGMTGNTQSVKVTLTGLSHTYPADIDMLLESPDGQRIILMSDCIGGTDFVNIDLSISDSASIYIPSSAGISSGSYKATNYTSPDAFQSPVLSFAAPVGNSSSPLSIFNGLNPNGTWKLYIMDDAGTDFGSINSWSLSIKSSENNTVIGPDTVCQGQSTVAFSVSNYPNASGYNWSLPAGASIVGGMNTNSITVDFSGSASSGTIIVTPVNSCGNGPASPPFQLIVESVVTASVSISAAPSGSICTGETVNFTAIPVNGGTLPSYQWKKNGINVGTNSSTYSDNGLNSGDLIECAMISNRTCATPKPADSNILGMTVSTCTVTLDLKLFLQGFYIGGSSMRPVINPTGFPTLCDTITVELHNALTPFALAYSTKGILEVDGTGSFNFPPTAFGNTYYIVIRHRNALETWSANTLSLNTSNNYDFSTSASQAYGSNQASMGASVFAIWSGDITNGINPEVQDGIIGQADHDYLETMIQQLLNGYLVPDLTGDNLIETADFSLIENNLNLNVLVSRP